MGLSAVNRVGRQVNAILWWTGLRLGFLLPKDVHHVHDVHALAHLVASLLLVDRFRPGRLAGDPVLCFCSDLAVLGRVGRDALHVDSMAHRFKEY